MDEFETPAPTAEGGDDMGFGGDMGASEPLPTFGEAEEPLPTFGESEPLPTFGDAEAAPMGGMDMGGGDMGGGDMGGGDMGGMGGGDMGGMGGMGGDMGGMGGDMGGMGGGMGDMGGMGGGMGGGEPTVMSDPDPPPGVLAPPNETNRGPHSLPARSAGTPTALPPPALFTPDFGAPAPIESLGAPEPIQAAPIEAGAHHLRIRPPRTLGPCRHACEPLGELAFPGRVRKGTPPPTPPTPTPTPALPRHFGRRLHDGPAGRVAEGARGEAGRQGGACILHMTHGTCRSMDGGGGAEGWGWGEGRLPWPSRDPDAGPRPIAPASNLTPNHDRSPTSAGPVSDA